MTDLKKVVLVIKERYSSKESTFAFIAKHASALGVQQLDTRAKKWSFRGEKTPSCVANEYLSYRDYGDATNHNPDVVGRIMEYRGLSFPEAVRFLSELENLDVSSTSLESFKPAPRVVERKEYKQPFKKGYLYYKSKYAQENKELFNELLDGLCRSCSKEEKERAVFLFNIGLDTFETKEGKVQSRLFIPEMDEKKVAWNCFHYNRSLTPKGLLRRDGKRCLFGSHLLRNQEKVILTEGHSDCIVNNAKGLISVSSGSSTTAIPEEGLMLLKGRHVLFAPDADIAGWQGAIRKMIQIEEFNSSLKQSERISFSSLYWGDFIASKDDEKLNIKKGDVIDKAWLQAHQHLFFKDVELKKEMLVENWKQVHKSAVKQGYDFVDFHNQHKNDGEKYSKFLASLV